VLGAAKTWPQILQIGSLKDIRPTEAADAELEADKELESRA
jgi:hypothetical protein